MGKITKVKTTNRDEWKELRHGYIGGSDAAAVVGLNPFSSAYSLWAEKTGRIPPFEGNLATEVGTYLEDFVAKKFEEVTGKKVRKSNQSILNSRYPWAIANIDRDIVGEDAGLEIKTTDSLNLKRFKGGEYPANYYVQMVHYMAVTGKKKWYLAVLVGNREFLWYELERDEDEISALMTAEKEFWQHVTDNIPPAVDGADSTTETIGTIYADSDGTSVDLYPVSGAIRRFLDLSAQIKELETLKDEASNEIKSYMGASEVGTTDFGKVTWKSSKRCTFDAKRFASDNPDIDLSNYYNTTTVRAFKLTEAKGDQ